MTESPFNFSWTDAHLHLWDIKRMHYPWLDTVTPIRRSFFIEDYREAAKQFPIQHMVFVQADCLPDEYMEEVHFVEEQAGKDDRIRGIVAYAPLEKGKEARRELEELKRHPLVKGVRRMYDNEPELCCSAPFIAGLQLLPSYGFSFDISIKPHVMQQTVRMIARCPETRFILDHLGKPDIRNRDFEAYKRNIALLASFPNVTAKISGLITEADPDSWTPAMLKPYIDQAIQCFGPGRLMFGGDWPVVLLAGTYDRWIRALEEALEDYSSETATAVFCKNALKIYNLS
ncbi:amidohydrolase family protein [Compostibacter hankyongensis]|uniref:Amidohydrolase family protein n=1 Tax=Compostibacter hankyongensis TaxID=1007089 RepID=A0ABP8FLS9_9BACT